MAKISRRRLIGLAAGLVFAPTRLWAADENAKRAGILLLAHGSHAMPHGATGAHDHDHDHHAAAPPDPWNDNIIAIARDLNARIPTEVAFGMAETSAMQAGIARLEKRGITRIVAIPLYISSHSPIIGNFRYILGLQENLGSRTVMTKLARVQSTSKFVFSNALDADPLVSAILEERARAMSADAAKTNVVIVAHGPNHDEDNKLWLADMEKHAAYLKNRGFRTVEVLTHRNDAPKDIKDAARAAFRARVEAAGRDGTTVVVPLLMSQGGIEHEVESDLEGLKFVFAKPLAPHPNLARWVEARFRALSNTF